MRIYFKKNGYEVVEYKDLKFAKYAIISNKKAFSCSRVFNNLSQAILYCIALSEMTTENCYNSDAEIMIYIDTFLTMIHKSK